MHKAVSDYLNTVCNGIRSEKRQQSVRAELAGHFAEAMEASIQNGLSEEEAALRACAQMGDVEEVSQKLTAANRQVPSISIFIAGGVIIIIALILTMFFSGNGFYLFADIQSLLTVVGIAVGLALMGGIIGMTKELFFSRMIKTALYGGGIGFFINLIALLNNVPAYTEDFVNSLGVCSLSVLYGMLMSALSLAACWLVRTVKPKDARDVLEIRDSIQKDIESEK